MHIHMLVMLRAVFDCRTELEDKIIRFEYQTGDNFKSKRIRHNTGRYDEKRANKEWLILFSGRIVVISVAIRSVFYVFHCECI